MPMGFTEIIFLFSMSFGSHTFEWLYFYFHFFVWIQEQLISISHSFWTCWGQWCSCAIFSLQIFESKKWKTGFEFTVRKTRHDNLIWQQYRWYFSLFEKKTGWKLPKNGYKVQSVKSTIHNEYNVQNFDHFLWLLVTVIQYHFGRFSVSMPVFF